MKTILSGMQPTGSLHIGNYLGALKHWVQLQDSRLYTCIFTIVDLHAMTLNFNPKHIQEKIKNLMIDYLSCGIDPQKSIIFIQSHVPEHTYLSWIFSTLTQVAALQRMHQFKEKTTQHKEAAMNVGLFTYPVLQAADILIYKADTVPVGEDQKQHIELTRDIARKFNITFGNTFPETQVLLTKTPRIMSLIEPENKMSKSRGEKNYIALTDDKKTVRKKLMNAVTDVGPRGKSMSKGVANLFALLKAFVSNPALYLEMKKAYNAKTLQYKTLKEIVAEEITKTLSPIQKRRLELERKPEYLAEVLIEGIKKARAIAQATLQEVREKTGLL